MAEPSEKRVTNLHFRTTPDMARKIRSRAVIRGVKQGDIVAEAIGFWLQEIKRGEEKESQSETKPPMFTNGAKRKNK